MIQDEEVKEEEDIEEALLKSEEKEDVDAAALLKKEQVPTHASSLLIYVVCLGNCNFSTWR